MEYHPKLKKAIAEIKDILDKYDIAGVVVIHTPGHSEYLTKINPSYSCGTLIEGKGLHMKAKLADFNGDKEAMHNTVQDTVNMIHHLAEVTGLKGYEFIQIKEQVDEYFNPKYTDGGHTSHTQQNN